MSTFHACHFENKTNLETGYTREVFASFPQVLEEDTPGTSVSCPSFFASSHPRTLCPIVISSA